MSQQSVDAHVMIYNLRTRMCGGMLVCVGGEGTFTRNQKREKIRQKLEKKTLDKQKDVFHNSSSPIRHSLRGSYLFVQKDRWR